MRTLARNKVKMRYAQYLAESPNYILDEDGNRIIEYVTDEGDVIYAETGESTPTYATDEELLANIAESGGEAEAQEYGLSVSDYEAILVFEKGAYPIKEGSLIWVNSPVEYQYGGTEIEVDVDGVMVSTKAPIKTSADFIVIKTPQSLNFTKAILKAVEK